MSVIKLARKTAKKGYVWAYVFRHQGKVHKKEGFLTRGEASEAEGRRRSKVRGIPYTPPRIFLGEVADRYLIECKTVKGLADNTLRQKRFVLKTFMDFRGTDGPAELITRGDIKPYLTVRAQISGNCAANRDKKEIKALFNWANNEDILFCRNPCKGLPDFPEDESRAYTPPKEDLLKVKLQAGGDERDFINCVHYLLGRRKEIQMLRWHDINFQTRWADLFTRKKGGGLKRMPKPMNDEVVRILERRRRRARKGDDYIFSLTMSVLGKMMPRLCRGADVIPFGFHSVRHYGASTLLERGHTIKEIQFLLGHERASTTERYLHVKAGDFHRIVNSLQDKTLRSVTLNSLSNEVNPVR